MSTFPNNVLCAVPWAILICFSSMQVPEASECAHDATTFRCVKYLNNPDGDTIIVEISDVPPLLGHRASVRILGIDTPEVHGNSPCEKSLAITARKEVEGILRSAKRIDLTHVSRDKYFRILANINVDGASLSQKLLNAHLAIPYGGGTKGKADWCTQENKL